MNRLSTSLAINRDTNGLVIGLCIAYDETLFNELTHRAPPTDRILIRLPEPTLDKYIDVKSREYTLPIEAAANLRFYYKQCRLAIAAKCSDLILLHQQCECATAEELDFALRFIAIPSRNMVMTRVLFSYLSHLPSYQFEPEYEVLSLDKAWVDQIMQIARKYVQVNEVIIAAGYIAREWLDVSIDPLIEDASNQTIHKCVLIFHAFGKESLVSRLSCKLPLAYLTSRRARAVFTSIRSLIPYRCKSNTNIPTRLLGGFHA